MPSLFNPNKVITYMYVFSSYILLFLCFYLKTRQIAKDNAKADDTDTPNNHGRAGLGHAQKSCSPGIPGHTSQ